MKLRSSGSALLLVLLMLVGFSGTLFIIARSLRDSLRVTTSFSSIDEATRMARSGLEEGLRRVAVGTSVVPSGSGTIITVDAHGEYLQWPGYGSYGNASSRYLMRPWRRGFTTDANGNRCGQITLPTTIDDSGSIDLSCPYYDLEIRRIVAADAAPDTLFRAKDLPAGVTKTYDFYQSSDSSVDQPIVLFTNGTGSFSCDTGCTDLTGTPSPQTYNFSTGIRLRNDVVSTVSGTPRIPDVAPAQLQLRLNAGSQPLDPKAVFYPQNTPSTNGGQRSLVIGRPETYIIATGYSAGVRKRLVITIPYVGALTYKIFDFWGGFTYKGAIIN